MGQSRAAAIAGPLPGSAQLAAGQTHPFHGPSIGEDGEPNAIRRAVELTLWSLLQLVPLGFLAGLLSGLLGIGGGLIFSPLLLLLGLDPHQALATSSLAIVPTTLGGSWSHLRSRSLPLASSLAIVIGAAATSGGLSPMGRDWSAALLLSLQAGLYAVLCAVLRPSTDRPNTDRPNNAGLATGPTLVGLVAIGAVAGLATALLGVGGGLIMVPLMVRLLHQPVHLAIRLSTLAVLVSSVVAAPTFVTDGRGFWPVALLLGGAAGLAARWSAARLDRVPESRLIWMLRLLTALLAADSTRRAVLLVLERGG